MREYSMKKTAVDGMRALLGNGDVTVTLTTK